MSHHKEVAGFTEIGGSFAVESVAGLVWNTQPSPFLTGIVEPTSNMRWETHRGCPFKCSFCQHRDPGNRLRNQWLDIERLDREAEWFAHHAVKRISVLDPIFHVNTERAGQRLKAIKRSGLKAQLSLQCRFELVTPGFLDALNGLNVTLEFGLQTIIPREYKAIGRPNNMGKVEAVIKRITMKVS